jgi:predicted outer membrane protein
MNTMRIAAALLAAVTATTACAPQGSEAAERRVDTAARRDSIAAVAAATMTEPAVLGLLDATHGADSALGVFAITKGSTLEIKDFGRMIMREHHALRREVQKTASELGLAIEAPRVEPDAPPPEMRQALESGPAGPAWDYAYLDYAIAMQRSAKENAARALAATKSPVVRQFIERSVPILEKHLLKAQSLRTARTQAADSAPPR